MSAERERLYRSLVPAGVPLHDPVFYDEQSVPRVFQVFDGSATAGVYRTRQGTASANDEFPWSDPAGTTGPGASVRWVSFGGPVLWWRERHRDGTFGGFAWEYAPGTTFGEALLQNDSSGVSHAWEVRTRTKRGDGGWSPQVYRPFVTEEDLAAALQERGVGYRRPPARRLAVDSGHARDGFKAEGWTVHLPSLPEGLVASLLDGATFEPALGRPFRVTKDVTVEAPTGDADFGIVPKGYLGWALPVSRESCMRCHRDAGRTVNLAGERRWRLRGNDFVWSFHPLALDGDVLRLNPKLVEARLVAHKPGER